jgi:lipopolysaccharide transport system permease protein
MVVFVIIFKKLARLPSEGDAPYPILVYAAMLPWQLFANSLQESSNSLIGNSQLISKVYFPRLIIPTSSVLVNLIDFMISFAILVCIMAWYQYIPGWEIVLIPIFLGLAMVTALGIGFLLCALNVKYRDFRYIIPFIVQFGLYVSPVGFSSTIIPGGWRLIYSVNPMVGVIDGFRLAILGADTTLYWPGMIISMMCSLLLFMFGIWYFRNTEKTFADVI